jgi:N-acetylmuramoyl-L-alanine amidase
MKSVYRKFLVLGAFILSLSGCATNLVIDRSLSSVSQDSRVRFLIIHYTWGNAESSLKTLTQGEVSSHYWVDFNPPLIRQLVDEDKRAYHAGVSFWKGATALNASSIGIEIVNAGGRFGPDGQLRYADYPKEQIDLVIALVRDIVQRHKISPDRVLGHSDIAPGRKTDPGPNFPWKRLANEGLAIWFDEAKAASLTKQYSNAVPDIAWFQNRLRVHGFNPPASGQLDQATKEILKSFQLRFRPAKFDGEPDAETAAILDVITTPAK